MVNSLFKVFICSIFLIGASFAAPVKLPQPMGPFAVGTRGIELSDDSRRMLRDTSPRRWMVQSFYPAGIPKGGFFPYMPGTLEDIRILAHSKPSAPLIKQGPLPVIIFVPGFGEVRQSYTILCEELASQGFVVLALDQPYVSSFVRFADGQTIVPTLYDVWKTPRDRSYRYQYYDEAMRAAINDVKYMLDHFDYLNQTYFEDRLNTKKIILMGHSFGGNVAHTLGFDDSRIQAVVDIDSKITEKEIYGRVGIPPNTQAKPVLFIRAMRQYQEEVGDQLIKVPHAEIWSPEVQHSAFRDMVYLSRRIPDIKQQSMISKAWNWFWKLGPLFDAVDTGIGDQEIDQWVKEYRTKVVEWLQKTVDQL